MKNNFYELLGLAGSGKSTAMELLKKGHPNYTFIMHDKKLGLHLINNLYMYMRIYYHSKNLDIIKLLLMFHIFLYNLKKGRIKDNYIFDQGPVFIISMLIYEVPTMKEDFYKELRKIIPFYNKIIYLEAPFEVLYKRINSRTQKHRIKNKEKSKQASFLKAHSDIYEQVLEFFSKEKLNVIRINTDVNKPIDVIGKINASLK